MVTENTPYRNKKYIVEDLGFDTKFKTEKEIQSLEIKNVVDRDTEIDGAVYNNSQPMIPQLGMMDYAYNAENLLLHNEVYLPLKEQFHKDLLSLRKNAHDRQLIDRIHYRNNTLLLRR